MSAYDEKVDAVLFKHEDRVRSQPIGPVWVRRDRVTKPLVEGEPDFTGKPSAKWHTLRHAKAEAKAMGLPFFEV